MINILIPLAGQSAFFKSEEYIFPQPLIEIRGKPIIQLVTENLQRISDRKRFIFVLNDQDCVSFHLDNIVSLLTDGNCDVIRLKSQTRGAACSCLMAIAFIDNDDELIISNADQIIAHSLDDILLSFRRRNCDAGVICFESVHPRWSFVRLDENQKIIETAEKRVISKMRSPVSIISNMADILFRRPWSPFEETPMSRGLITSPPYSTS